MSCNPTFQKAVDALKEAVKVSLDTDVKPSQQSEIWRHYQGMKAIAAEIKSTHKHTSYDLDRLDTAFDYTADTTKVNTFTTNSDDVITFV